MRGSGRKILAITTADFYVAIASRLSPRFASSVARPSLPRRLSKNGSRFEARLIISLFLRHAPRQLQLRAHAATRDERGD